MKTNRLLQSITWMLLAYLSLSNLFALETGLSIDDGKQTERNSIEFLVSMSAKPAIPIEVVYATVDGTAKAGYDYNKSVGKVIIPLGEKKAFINVPLIYNLKNSKKPTTFYLTITSQKTAVFIPKAVGLIHPDQIRLNSIANESNVSKGGIK